MGEGEGQHTPPGSDGEAAAAADLRHRIIVEPAFREAYNELVRADRQFPVPEYLWEKWVPVLGVFTVSVYIELRRMCFWNPRTGEKRDHCWPKQETIAKRLGVKKRHTVGAALRVLEEKGFIKRERKYRLQARGDGAKQRTSDKYTVYFECPLVGEDLATLARRKFTSTEEDGGYMAAKRPNTIPVVETEGFVAEIRPESAGRKSASRTITLPKTDVVNVRSKTQGGNGRLSNHPVVASMATEERTEREALALEVGDTLHRMDRNGSLDSHRSSGFHRRVCMLMPTALVREALMATRDAVERQRGGGTSLSRGPGAYFAGIVKNLANENGIELGLKNEPKPSSGTPVPSAGPRQDAKMHRGEVSDMEGAPMEASRAKEELRMLIESLAKKTRL